jgi:RHS repeat-associated protein
VWKSCLQRWQQQANYAGSSETTTYIAGLLEKVVTPSGTAYRHFIPAGNSLVVHLPSAGAPTVQYVTGDHLSSTATITDTNGNVLLGESFSPWGARRSPTNWSLRQSSADAVVLATTMRQGFTGHEHLDNLDLINMNGRLYQGTGFMSPDPHITDPTNPQNYNRYSYVDNNPLSLVDPSGFDFCLYLPINNPPPDDGVESSVSVTATPLPYMCISGSFPEPVQVPNLPTQSAAGGGYVPQQIPCQTGISCQSPQTKPVTTLPCITGAPSSANNPKTGPNMIFGGLLGGTSFGIFAGWAASQLVPIAGEAADAVAAYRTYWGGISTISTTDTAISGAEQLNIMLETIDFGGKASTATAGAATGTAIGAAGGMVAGLAMSSATCVRRAP